MTSFWKHSRTYIIRGLLASIPLFLCLLIVKLIYEFIDKKVMNIADQFIGYRVPGLGVLLVLIILYLVGIFVSNVIGRQIFVFIESIFNRIPILKTMYQIGKQFSSSFSVTEKQAFKQAVLVESFKGVWVVGFVTGTIIDKNTNETLSRVFIPTVPNPTTGFVIVVKQEQLYDPHWSIEEALKAIISGGIIGPDTIEKKERKTP